MSQRTPKMMIPVIALPKTETEQALAAQGPALPGWQEH